MSVNDLATHAVTDVPTRDLTMDDVPEPSPVTTGQKVSTDDVDSKVSIFPASLTIISSSVYPLHRF